MNDSSHQGALLGRYVGPVREVFAGDPQQCAQYVPLGRKLLGYLKNTLGAGGIEVGGHRLVLPNGVRVAARVDGCNHIVYIDVRYESQFSREVSIWMETGWVNLENLSDHAVPLTHSFIYYGSRQYAALELEFPRWLDELVLVLNEQGAIVRMREGVVRSPHAPTHPNYPNQSYIESLGFQAFEYLNNFGNLRLAYTRTQACVPNPGYATGKLKLYLQALLGGIGNPAFVFDEKDKVDQRSSQVVAAIRTIMGNYWAEINPGIAFNWDFSRGLFTTDNYQYWIISIVNRGIYAQTVAIPWRNALFRHRMLGKLQSTTTSVLERSKIEAYILSASTEFGPVITVSDTILNPLIGSPLHEGWKFNYRGDEAQIVVKETVKELNTANGILTIKSHIFRRYKLTFTYSETNKESPFSASFELIEEVESTPSNKCLRPFRKPQSVGHVLEWEDWKEWIIGPGAGYLFGEIEYDAPMYCWYCRNENGDESFITVRDVVKWPDSQLSISEVRELYSQYSGPTGPVIVCAGGGYTQVNNVLFKDMVNALRGYYIRVESGNNTNIIEELKEANIQYYFYNELLDGRVEVVPKGVTSGYSPGDFGGYINFTFPSGQLQCDGSLASVPIEAVGGTGVNWTVHYGTVESLRLQREGTMLFSFVLVFPQNDGESVYIQKNELANAGDNLYYQFGGHSTLDWNGTAHFSDGHSVDFLADLRFYMAYQPNLSESFGNNRNFDPLADKTEYSYRFYGGLWSVIEDHRRLYFASAHHSKLVFDETATQTTAKPFSTILHWPTYLFYTDPPFGIETSLCFGKHEWYVIIDLIEFWPWFDALVAINESFNGDAIYLQQWGPFMDGVQMPYEPIYNTTDNHYPIFSSTDEFTPTAEMRQFHAVFVGWA